MAQKLDEQGWVQLAKMAEMGLSAASIVHEVRQPLSALKMALQLMRHSEKDPRAMHECLEDALRQAERLERLLGQMRNFLRPNVQGRTPVDLVQLVSDVLALLTRDLQSKQVEIVTHFEPDLQPILMERHKVEHVLFNLIINARDAVLDSGGGRITTLVLKNDTGGVDVIIADNGSGVESALRTKIFEPFFSTKGETKGTGLGLYIAKRIAEQNNATLHLLNKQSLAKLGKNKLGTGFCLSFPGNTDLEKDPPTAHSDASESDLWNEADAVNKGTDHHRAEGSDRPTPLVKAPWPKAQRKRADTGPDLDLKIILIEPGHKIREQLVDILLGLGCRVKACQSAEDAIDEVQNKGADVLVARADVLRKHRSWIRDEGNEQGTIRTSVAIMDRGGVDRAIEAIHLGARGVFSPPFEESKIALELKRAALLPTDGGSQR